MTDLARLLTGPEARAALAQRDIPVVYRILRDAAVSQTRIARATGQQQSDVSAIIAGRRVQSIALLERIADGLGVPRGWMGLAYAPDLVPEPADEAETEDERKDNLFRHAGTVLFGEPIFGPADPIRVQPDPTPVPSRIGAADVAQVAATTEQLGQLAADLGGIPMTNALTAHARASEALLGATMSEPVRQRLLLELADAYSAAGGAAGGAGLRDLARRHWLRAMEYAGQAKDRLRAVVNLDRMGCLDLHVEPNDALKFFQLSEAAAPTALSRALVEHHGALALGLLGLAEEALATLRRAQDRCKAARHEPRPWKHFAIALPHVEGQVYLALGRFDDAAAALAVDVAAHAIACTMSSAAYLAAAQLRCGELRSGLCTAERAVSLAKGLRSVSVGDNLAPLQEAAAARRDSACRDLAYELAKVRAAA